MSRNYRNEYLKYQGTPAQKKRRAQRNAARRAALRSGRVKKGDGLDIHHKDGNPMNNHPGNLSVRNKSSNRSFPRDKRARKR